MNLISWCVFDMRHDCDYFECERRKSLWVFVRKLEIMRQPQEIEESFFFFWKSTAANNKSPKDAIHKGKLQTKALVVFRRTEMYVKKMLRKF